MTTVHCAWLLGWPDFILESLTFFHLLCRGGESQEEVKQVPPAPPQREELTALKALDKLLRTYDRRSTPTNDLGKPKIFYFLFKQSGLIVRIDEEK